MSHARPLSSAGYRVRFSTTSPARHTYSSSGEDSDDDDFQHQDSDVFDDPGPSRRLSHRQSLPANFVAPQQPSQTSFPPPPRRSVTPSTSTPPAPSKRSFFSPKKSSQKSSSTPNGHTHTGDHTVTAASPSTSPQSISSERLGQMTFSSLENSLAKAPPSQRTPSSLGFFKSNNPFRKRHASQPTPSTVPSVLSAPAPPPPAPAPRKSTLLMPPPPVPPPRSSNRPKATPPRSGTPAPGAASGASTVLTIASGSTTKASSKPSASVGAAPETPTSRPAHRRASISSESTVPSLPNLSLPKSIKKGRSSRASSSSSMGSFSGSLQGATSAVNPSAIIKKSLMAAEQARESKLDKQGDGSVQVVKKWEPPQAETLLQSMNGKSAASITRSSSVKTWSPASTPKLVRKATGGSVKNAAIIQSVHSALRDAEADDGPKSTPVRKVRPKMDFESIAKRHAAQDPNVLLWSCTDLLSNKGSRKNRYAMIILNQPITRKDVFVRAWAASEVRLCADGGANRLYDLWGPSQSSKYLPDMVKGDLDSLRPEVESFYASKGVTIKHDSDQYSTDLMKCMEEVENIERASGRRYSLVFIGGLSGRVDQTVHTMHILHKLRKTRPLTFVLSCESLAWTLDAGSHLIDIDHSTMGQTCGILPVGVDSATVKTKGLKWDLDWATSLDTSVSTSNHLLPSEPVVQVQTSRPLLWCVEIKPNLDAAPVPAVRDVKSPVGVSEFGTGRVSRVGTY